MIIRIIILLFITIQLFANNSDKIFILASYHENDVWTEDFLKGIKSELNNKTFELFIEFMDARRHKSAEYENKFDELLMLKYKNIDFNAIISIDDVAFSYLLKHDDFVKNKPIIFGGVNFIQNYNLENHKNITGITENISIQKTIDMALKFHPKTKYLVPLCNKTGTNSITNLKLFYEVAEKYLHLKIIEKCNLTIDNLKEELKNIPKNSIAFQVASIIETGEKDISPKDATEIIKKYINIPIYTFWKAFMNSGAMGGFLVNGFNHGKETAVIVKKIINGQSISEIPIIYESPNSYIFDFKELKKFNIDKNLIPENSLILNEEKSLFETYKYQIITIIIFIIVETIIILLLIINIIRRKSIQNELKKSQEQMFHVQKLESLGVLSGGIAHDFNNLLTAILGYSELTISEIQQNDCKNIIKNINEIKSASLKAADFVKQILIYSGKSKAITKPLNMSQLIKDMGKLLEVAISKKTNLIYEINDKDIYIEGDSSQLSQIFMNLIVNASESLNNKEGFVKIKTDLVYLKKDFLKNTNINYSNKEGEYILIEITDNGCGIEKDKLSKIFEPFYTTKFTGRGLGLSAVVGIVKNHNGIIKVESELNKGTTFKIYFPVSKNIVTSENVTEKQSFKGKGLILLIDDEEIIRKSGKQILEHINFEVITASNGLEGIELFKKFKNEIECVILDLIMPNMDGKEVFEHLIKIDENVNVILCSGYSESDIEKYFENKKISGILEKPYKINQLKEILSKTIAVKNQ